MTNEQLAKKIFEAAIREGRCAELMECLFDNGSPTVDPSGNLVLVTSNMLKQMMGE